MLKEISEGYHDLDRELARRRNRQKDPVEKWVYFTNPLWIFKRLIQLLFRYKLIAIATGIILFLATDFAVAWKNTIWIKDQILNFLG